MLLDLVSPWLTAVGTARAQAVFRDRHAELLELLRRQRAPLADILPLATDLEILHPLAQRAADPATQQCLRDAIAVAADLGADCCHRVVLLVGGGDGESVEPLPGPSADAVVFLDRVADETGLLLGVGRAIAALTRWSAPDSLSRVRVSALAGWDRWQASRDVPLREWIYAEGLGIHLAHALAPELSPPRLLGINQTAFVRLREREKVFRGLLAADLDQSGIGLILRWLTPNAPSGPRTVQGEVLPSMAGRYLAWRMLAERVARVGLREALRMEA